MKEPTAIKRFITTQVAQPLESVLQKHLPQYTAGTIIDAGGVWLNKKRLKDPQYIIPENHTVTVYISPTQGYRYAFSHETIIEETSDWIVVYKEPLITIGMDRSNQYFNLMAGLNDYYGHTDIRKGVQPITRLDYRVAGLTLFTKTKQAERLLFRSMQNRDIKKRYIMAIPGTKYRKWYRIRNKLNCHQKAYIDPKNGKIAKTAITFLNEKNDMTLFNVSTQTGRRHQIRFHAASHIAPLVNDELYGAKNSNRHIPIGLLATHLRFPWNAGGHTIRLPEKWQSEWWSAITNI